MDSFLDFPEKFTLAHPDVFYTNGILESFLEMTANLIAHGDIPGEKFVMKFVNGRPEQKVVETLNLEDNMQYTGENVSPQERLRELADSEAVLFIQRGTGDSYISEKFYELLTLKKKVLAVVPNPVAYEEIANRDGDVYVAHIKNQAQITEMFLKMYADWEKEEEMVFYSNLFETHLQDEPQMLSST
jgi:hypothetical protein